MMSLSKMSMLWGRVWGFRGESSNFEIIPRLAFWLDTPEKATLFRYKKLSKFLPLSRLPSTV